MVADAGIEELLKRVVVALGRGGALLLVFVVGDAGGLQGGCGGEGRGEWESGRGRKEAGRPGRGDASFKGRTARASGNCWHWQATAQHLSVYQSKCVMAGKAVLTCTLELETELCGKRFPTTQLWLAGRLTSGSAVGTRQHIATKAALA